MIDAITGNVRLNTGVEMPGFGFGCYKAEGHELHDALLMAIDAGYRYIDSAAFYENETEVGEALAISPVPRHELFIVSKIWPCSFDKPVKALDTSLAELRLEYLDGYLLHWPGLDEAARYRAYEKLLREAEKGKIRVLGVSNFQTSQLSELRERFGSWAPINQIEVHPLFQETDLCDFCMERDIQVVSWSPLGRGREMNLEAIADIAERSQKSWAQVLLRWQIQKNYIPIPKSVHGKRIVENADVFNFSLSKEQMEVIDGLDLPANEGRIGKDPMSFPVC